MWALKNRQVRENTLINVSIPKPIQFTKNIEAIVREFTSRRGTPLNWTDLSVSQRIIAVESKFGKRVSIGLNAAYTVVYQDASEMIHGSYLGALKSLGREPFKETAIDIEAIQANNRNQYVYGLCALFNAIYFTLEVFSAYTEISRENFSLDELHDQYFEALTGESKLDYLCKKNQ